MMVLRQLPSGFRLDKFEDGWKLADNVYFEGDSNLLTLNTFLHESEFHINGHAMLERAKEMGSRAGQRHAEQMLEQQETIPHLWRKFYLIFAGTIWCDLDDNLHVLCLYYRKTGWHPYWSRLNNDFYTESLLVHLIK